MPDFLRSGPSDAATIFLFAHGAGIPMDAAWINAVAEKLADNGLAVARFEFAYMAARRSGQRKPPPKAEPLMEEYRAAVEALLPKGRLIVGGKSMGGRIASMLADELLAAGQIAGLVCLGYPFHPPGQPEKLRTAHLKDMKTPALICQGTRDPFGTREEVAAYALSPAIAVRWLEDGDHDFKPRKPLSQTGHIAEAAARIAAFAAGLR